MQCCVVCKQDCFHHHRNLSATPVLSTKRRAISRYSYLSSWTELVKRMKTGLQLSAQLENLSHFTPVGEDFRWYLKLTCSHCGEETPEFVYCSLSENAPLNGGRGEASLVIKCKLCRRENSIAIIKDSIKPYTEESSGKFQTIVAFDCRGVDVIDFSPRVGWETEGKESGTPFPDIDLGEMEWFDYDEKAGESVSITELKYQFVTIKK